MKIKSQRDCLPPQLWDVILDESVPYWDLKRDTLQSDSLVLMWTKRSISSSWYFLSDNILETVRSNWSLFRRLVAWVSAEWICYLRLNVWPKNKSLCLYEFFSLVVKSMTCKSTSVVLFEKMCRIGGGETEIKKITVKNNK